MEIETCGGDGLIVVGWNADAYENIEGPCPGCRDCTSAMGCGMVIGYKADANGDAGDEIVCGEPIWLVSDAVGGYCRKHAEETAAEGLDNFTKAEAEAYLAKKAAEQ